MIEIVSTPEALLEKVTALWIDYWTNAEDGPYDEMSPEEIALDDLRGWLHVMAENDIGWCADPLVTDGDR